MIPIKDDNPTKTVPMTTIFLIGVNVIAFVFIWMKGPREMSVWIARLGTIPREIVTMKEIYPPGNLYHAPFPPALTLVTSMFLHGGWLHLLGNMLYLWIFGDNIEALMGHTRFLVFYLVCGLAATLTHVFILPADTAPMIGASGAVSGLLGAYLLKFPRARIYVLIFFFFFIRIIRVPALLVLGIWFIIQVLNGMGSLQVSQTGGVAWFAHIGGFIAGMILIFLFAKRDRVRIHRRSEV
jgi:membrane associated rhomboid family serine protease